MNFLILILIEGPDFAFSWTGKPGKKFQSRKDQVKQKLSSLANSIYCKYFKDADLTPHGSMATLIQISKTINSCVNPNEVGKIYFEPFYKTAIFNYGYYSFNLLSGLRRKLKFSKASKMRLFLKIYSQFYSVYLYINVRLYLF